MQFTLQEYRDAVKAGKIVKEDIRHQFLRSNSRFNGTIYAMTVKEYKKVLSYKFFKIVNLKKAFRSIGIKIMDKVHDDVILAEYASERYCWKNHISVELFAGISACNNKDDKKYKNKYLIIVNHTLKIVETVDVTAVLANKTITLKKLFKTALVPKINYIELFSTIEEYLRFLKLLGYEKFVAYRSNVDYTIKLVDNTFHVKHDELCDSGFLYLDIQDTIDIDLLEIVL